VWASTTSDGNWVVNGTRCSAGGGQGIYHPIGANAPFYPVIQNNAAGSNTVQGVAFTP
jgi:hypothetical protein